MARDAPDRRPDRRRVATEAPAARSRAAAARARRRRLTAGVLTALILGVGAFAALGHTGASNGEHRSGPAAGAGATTSTAAPRPAAPFAVGLRVLTLVDRSRQVKRPGGGPRRPRTLVTYVRYPALGPVSSRDLPAARAAVASGRFPLIVFGHGFALEPGNYTRLLQSWTRAGYVVAAPVFPLENANAAGGPDESDLTNQPADMRLVISRLLADSAAPGGALSQLIDPAQIGVAGHSDGGETALALGYDRYYRDPRVRAAAILSGAVIPYAAGFTFPAGSPPLLATQGSADVVNTPARTRAFFRLAKRPKYLLALPGAAHEPPYTGQQPQLGVVERVTTAFFDLYLKSAPEAAARLRAAGSVPGIAALSAQP